jgi:hypothetical protein
MNIRKNYIFNNTFPIHYQSSFKPFEPKNMDDSFAEHLQHNELIEPNDNSENEQYSTKTKTIQHWSDSEIKTLLYYLSDNFDYYRRDWNRFYDNRIYRKSIRIDFKIDYRIKSNLLFYIYFYFSK